MSKRINQPVFLSKTIFFFVYAAGSVLLPFLALHYREIGLTGSQMGLLAGLPPLMTLIGASAWGALADATRRHKLVFVLVIFGSMLSVGLMPVINSFLVLSLVVALHAFCFMSLVPLLDNTALEILGKGSDKYGQIRLWGSVGSGYFLTHNPPVLNLLSSFVIDHREEASKWQMLKVNCGGRNVTDPVIRNENRDR